MVFEKLSRARILGTVLLAGATVLATAGSSLADTATGGSIFHTGPTDYSASLGYLAKFNPDAGTLTGVSFTVGYGFDSTITVSATTDSTGSVSTESAAQFSSSDAAVKAVLNALVNKTSAVIGSSQLNPAAYDLNGNKSIYNVGPTSGSPTATYNSSASASDTYNVSPSSFAAFVADQNSSVFDVLGSTLTGLILSATGGNALAQQSTTATQSISVQYTYDVASVTEVPEPASLALLGAGVIGMGTMRRRKVA